MIHEYVMAASKQLGLALRRNSDRTVPRCIPSDESLRAERSFLLLTQRQLFHQGDSPETMCQIMMLKQKDAGQVRSEMLAPEPSRTETDDEVTSHCIFDRGAMTGQILSRV